MRGKLHYIPRDLLFRNATCFKKLPLLATGAVVAVVGTAILFLALGIVLLCVWMRRRRRAVDKREKKGEDNEHTVHFFASPWEYLTL